MAHKAETKTSRLKYRHWGGLPATLESLDDFETVRADPELSLMFDKLDRLEISVESADWVKTMTACNFSPVEVSRINSPLLDGLWKAVTGREPDGTTPFEENPTRDVSSLVTRLLFPRFYEDAVRWVALETADDGVQERLRSTAASDFSLYSALQRAFVHAFCIGQTKALEMFRRHISLRHFDGTVKYLALLRAIRCGHLSTLSSAMYEMPCTYTEPSVGECIDPGWLDPSGAKYETLMKTAVRFGRVDVFDWLLSVRSGASVVLDDRRASSLVQCAAAGGHLEMVQHLLQRINGKIKWQALHQAWHESWPAVRPRLSALLADAVVSAGGTLDYMSCVRGMVNLKSVALVRTEAMVRTEAIATLLANMPRSNRVPFRSPLPAQSWPAMQMLREAGLLDASSYSRIDLIAAVRTGNLHLVRLALDVSGLTFTLVDMEEALCVAAIVGRDQLIDLLLVGLYRVHQPAALELAAVWSTGTAAQLYRHLERQRPFSADDVKTAARHGHIAMLDADRFPVDVPVQRMSTVALHQAFIGRQLIAAAHLYTLAHPLSSEDIGALFEKAADANDTYLLRFLHERCFQELLPRRGRVTFALLHAAVRGEQEQCEMLIPLMGKAPIIDSDTAILSLKRALAAAPSDGFAWFITTLLEQTAASDMFVGFNHDLWCDGEAAWAWGGIDTVLSEAVSSGRLDLVKILVNFGAGVHEQAYDFRATSGLRLDAAMRTALDRGHLQVVEFLVSRGARMPTGVDVVTTNKPEQR